MRVSQQQWKALWDLHWALSQVGNAAGEVRAAWRVSIQGLPYGEDPAAAYVVKTALSEAETALTTAAQALQAYKEADTDDDGNDLCDLARAADMGGEAGGA